MVPVGGPGGVEVGTIYPPTADVLPVTLSKTLDELANPKGLEGVLGMLLNTN
jgi:hypothetical protein